MERAPGRPSAQTSTLKPAGTLSLAALPVTSIANGCRGDFSCSALRPCCQEGGAAGAAGACACAAAAENTQTSAEAREMSDRKGAGDMEYPPFPGVVVFEGRRGAIDGASWHHSHARSQTQPDKKGSRAPSPARLTRTHGAPNNDLMPRGPARSRRA